ncbi:hypothetical protein M0805_009519 [Coniferiporia weirii]|nr:hypothetical protein M0805_009519 [Coniferiporia weirii]
MREKRKRNAAGLPIGERLNRNRLLAECDLRWNWIGTDVKHVSEITQAHRLRASGLALSRSKRPCSNKFLKKSAEPQRALQQSAVGSEDSDDVIVISESEEEPPCDKKRCKDNPYCLNYLGQDKWEDEVRAEEAYLKARLEDENPEEDSRDPTIPVGLKNLGATCYANAFLQVWFQDLAFRSGVYRCQPSLSNHQQFKESPIFQLQVTFAALQEGNQAVFNPIKLVESLRLRTSEQQDAQEFSKLFMSHLDDEFKKQSNPELQSLLPDKFEGKIVNATVCDKCKTRSERETTFLELEVNLEKNGVLEDRIAAILAPERLEGDNRYLCSVCESLQDATRHTEIRSLPSVLHISLLRFVYDLTTYERKKSKLPLKFPPYLNMNPFLQSSDPHQAARDKGGDGDVYELRGVLLHKGQSAYHGHYEAQVFSQATNKWYQFNDDTVTTLSSFHTGKSLDNNVKVDDGQEERPAKRQKRVIRPRRVEDSDEEKADQRLISKDAYMLIYARRENPEHASVNLLVPPPDALDIIKTSNEAHEKNCVEYKAKRDSERERFNKTCGMVMDIYRSWNISSVSDPSVIASKSAIEGWLLHWLTPVDVKRGRKEDAESGAKLPTQLVNGSTSISVEDHLGMLSEPEKQTDRAVSVSPAQQPAIINSSGLLCHHDRLNPLANKEMKLISKAARDKIVRSGYTFQPELTVEDICDECVEGEFLEKLYQIEHPQHVYEFDAICNTKTEHEGYWISKAWVKDWQLSKPKMHSPSHGDLPPDAPGFYSHVRCEHDMLALNVTSRRRVSSEAFELLKRLFPAWDPPTWDAKACDVCTAMMSVSKESRLEQRKKAEDEKAQLPRLNNDDIFGRQALVKNLSYAIVSSSFIHEWRSWLIKPGDVQRPATIDNSYMLCKHGKLNVDLSDESDFDNELAAVTREEWAILQDLYAAGPLITVSYASECTGDGGERGSIITDLPCCFECRKDRKLDFMSTLLTVILLKSAEPVPQSSSGLPPQPTPGDRAAALISGKDNVPPCGRTRIVPDGNTNGTRQSKRLKSGRNSCRRSVQIFKNWTVKDVKTAINKIFKIPIISQQLFYLGKELGENTDTVANLRILDKDTLYLKEINEEAFVLDSDIEECGTGTKKRAEGDAFKGTLLSGISSSFVLGESGAGPNGCTSTGKSCPSCTFLNDLDTLRCKVCDNPV